MDKEKVLELAREAGLSNDFGNFGYPYLPELERFAALIEREVRGDAEPVAFDSMTKRRVFDYIRGAYDLGYSDARNARAVPGDSAPGYQGRNVEVDHGRALLHALKNTHPAPAVVRHLVEAAEEMIDHALKIDKKSVYTMQKSEEVVAMYSRLENALAAVRRSGL